MSFYFDVEFKIIVLYNYSRLKGRDSVKKLRITKEDRKNFKKTRNGAIKYAWCLIGALIDIIATICISLLIIFSPMFKILHFYLLLYILLVVVVLGGEFIGTYYGALEQYMLNKEEKKKLSVE